MKQGLDAASFKNDAYGQSSAMGPPLIQDGYASTMGAPCIQGGYTSLLLGVDQNATLQSIVIKLYFDWMPNHEYM